MSGRNRLPGGEQRKASQKRSRPGAQPLVRIEIPWQPGDRVRWKDRAGVFGRDLGNGNVERNIDARIYRVKRRELRPA